MMASCCAHRLVCIPVLLVVIACGTSSASQLGAGADPGRVRSLEGALERGDGRLRELADAPLEIRAVAAPYEAEPGRSSRVLILDTDRGELIGRISYATSAKGRMVPWILQDEASRDGIAPALHKLIEGTALRTLFREHAALGALESPWPALPDSPPVSMVVMELVRDGFSFLQWDRSRRSLEEYPASALPEWTRRLRDIEAYFNGANVQIVDPQFLIQPDGNVMVVDFDHYTFVDSHDRRWGYSGVADYPALAGWKVPTAAEPLNDLTPSVRLLEGLFQRGSHRDS